MIINHRIFGVIYFLTDLIFTRKKIEGSPTLWGSDDVKPMAHGSIGEFCEVPCLILAGGNGGV
jgi:hypothetical protein